MDFLEKDLETIIAENYEACAARGLTIGQHFYAKGTAFRQLGLAPYGIADLVYARFDPSDNTYYLQVIELKKGRVDAAAYLQAKRYQTALQRAVQRANAEQGIEAEIFISTVLIGREVEIAGDFVFALNADLHCNAFVYSYGFDGIRFQNVGKQWHVNDDELSSMLPQAAAKILANRAQELETYWTDQVAHSASRADYIRQHGDYAKALVVTADGVFLNEDLLALPEGDSDGDQ